MRGTYAAAPDTTGAVYYRATFVATSGASASLRLSALGCYRAWLNGTPLTDEVFLPGRTSYRYRLQYQEFDVTKLLRDGTNVLAVRLTRGWYGQCGGVFCELAQGGRTLVDASSWKVSPNGPLLYADMKLGEVYDARKQIAWRSPDFDDSGWERAEQMTYGGMLIAHMGEPMREQERFSPTVLVTPDGSTVLDFGQNVAGYMEFVVTGSAGVTVKMLYGETLDEQGNFTQANLGFSPVKSTGNPPQTIEYILRDGTQRYKPQGSVHGYRYVKLEGWPEAVSPENFTSIAVYSDLAQDGRFSCSGAKVNQLVENCRWSAKGNFLDIPTDCPQRERAGWTGDIMVYSVPAAYQMNMRRFLNKWLDDLMLEQGDDGRVPNIAPVPNATTDMTVRGFVNGLMNSSVDGGMPGFMSGAAGWSDAIIKVPWVLYEFYGDEDALRRCYPAMRRHVAFMQERSRKRKPWHRLKPSHWDDLIDVGFHWGEWLEPGSSLPAGALKGFLNPDVEVASAYYAWSTGKIAQIASILGEDVDAERYQMLHERVLKAYRAEFLPDGLVHSKRQCRYVRPIALELAHEDDRRRIVDRLNDVVVANGYKVGTGFLSTPHVLNVLTDHGHADTAYHMLENEERPGWLYEVNRGATTIWESWDGIDEQGRPHNSLNHYSPGAVVAWLYSRCAGIRPLTPGFGRVLVAPVPGGSLTSVECTYESVAGRIVSNWRRDDKTVRLHVETPRPTEVRLPNGTVHEVGPGTYDLSCDM